MEKLYPLMFMVTAAAVTAGVVFFGDAGPDTMAKAPVVDAMQQYAAPDPVGVKGDAPRSALSETTPAPAVTTPEPAPVAMKTVNQPVCAIENGRKRCRFVSKEVPATPQD